MCPKKCRCCELGRKKNCGNPLLGFWRGCIVMCRFIKSFTYCSLEGLCVWKYLAGSRRTKERYLAEIKRDRKAQCNWNAFNSFKLFPFQSTRAKVKRGTKHFWTSQFFFVGNLVVSLQRTDSPGLCPVLPTREDQRTSRRRRGGAE